MSETFKSLAENVSKLDALIESARVNDCAEAVIALQESRRRAVARLIEFLLKQEESAPPTARPERDAPPPIVRPERDAPPPTARPEPLSAHREPSPPSVPLPAFLKPSSAPLTIHQRTQSLIETIDLCDDEEPRPSSLFMRSSIEESLLVRRRPAPYSMGTRQLLRKGVYPIVA